MLSFPYSTPRNKASCTRDIFCTNSYRQQTLVTVFSLQIPFQQWCLSITCTIDTKQQLTYVASFLGTRLWPMWRLQQPRSGGTTQNVERGRVLPGEVCIVGIAVNEMMFRCLWQLFRSSLWTTKFYTFFYFTDHAFSPQLPIPPLFSLTIKDNMN